MALSAGDRTRLARILGMLGSDHVGERAAAGAAADRLVRAAGITWEALLQPSGSDRPSSQTEARPRPRSGASDLQFCYRHNDRLTAWERNFVGSLPEPARWSAAQVAKVRQIADSLLARGFE